MNKLLLAPLLVVLAGCGTDNLVSRTAPGARLPDGVISRCHDNDEAGRCKDWGSDSPDCVNPRGIDAKPMIVPCASIKKGMTRDLMARFKGAATFVQDSQELLLEFYNKVGQNLHAWVASPPKLSISEPSKVMDGVVDAQTATEIDMPTLVPQIAPKATDSEG